MNGLAETLQAVVPCIVPLTATTMETAIRELVDNVFRREPSKAGENVTRALVYESILRREYSHPTGIEQGLAFPHARIEGWREFAVVAGISKDGIDFSSVDGKPSKIIFLMISSDKEAYVILQAMSAILKTLQAHFDFDKFVYDGISDTFIADIFKKVKINYEEKILVSHIACPVRHFVSVDTSIEKLTAVMHEERTDVLPVIDRDGKFCGEVSCRDVFQYGLPDFFSQLKTISFVKHIDPFDKVFKLKKNLTVEDLYNKNVLPMNSENTLMEIIFEMTVKKRSKLFVVDDSNTLVGVIDRFTILDKILFF